MQKHKDDLESGQLKKDTEKMNLKKQEDNDMQENENFDFDRMVDELASLRTRLPAGNCGKKPGLKAAHIWNSYIR